MGIGGRYAAADPPDLRHEGEAVAYAKRHGLAYEVEGEHERARQPIAYADNFRPDRRFPWTH
jgi:hypothetical protein